MGRRGAGDYEPAWEDVEAFVRSSCRNHLWKVFPDFDYDDLYQEAAFKFLELVKQSRAVNRQHFLGFFRKAWSRRLVDLSRQKMRRSRLPTVHFSDVINPDDEEDVVEVAVAVEANPFLQEVMLAPEGVTEVLAGLEAGQTFRPLSVQGRKETVPERLARLAGRPIDADAIRAWASKLVEIS